MTRLATLLLFIHIARGVLGAEHQPLSALTFGQAPQEQQQLLVP